MTAPRSLRLAVVAVVIAVLTALTPLMALANHDYSKLEIPDDGVHAFENVARAGDMLILARYSLTETGNHRYAAAGL